MQIWPAYQSKFLLIKLCSSLELGKLKFCTWLRAHEWSKQWKLKTGRRLIVRPYLDWSRGFVYLFQLFSMHVAIAEIVCKTNNSVLILSEILHNYKLVQDVNTAEKFLYIFVPTLNVNLTFCCCEWIIIFECNNKTEKQRNMSVFIALRVFYIVPMKLPVT